LFFRENVLFSAHFYLLQSMTQEKKKKQISEKLLISLFVSLSPPLFRGRTASAAAAAALQDA
jgi:hypothetical protein